MLSYLSWDAPGDSDNMFHVSFGILGDNRVPNVPCRLVWLQLSRVSGRGLRVADSLSALGRRVSSGVSAPAAGLNPEAHVFQLSSAGGAVSADAATPADAAVHVAVQGWDGDGSALPAADPATAAAAAGYVMTPSDGASSVSPQSSGDGE